MLQILGVLPSPPSSGQTVCITFSGGPSASVSVSYDGGPAVSVTPTHGASGVSSACFGWPPGTRGARVIVVQGTDVVQTYVAGL